METFTDTDGRVLWVDPSCVVKAIEKLQQENLKLKEYISELYIRCDLDRGTIPEERWQNVREYYKAMWHEDPREGYYKGK